MRASKTLSDLRAASELVLIFRAIIFSAAISYVRLRLRHSSLNVADCYSLVVVSWLTRTIRNFATKNYCVKDLVLKYFLEIDFLVCHWG